MSNLRFAICVIAVFIGGSAINGCYTMLIHPQVKLIDDSTGSENQTGVMHSERCTDCHTGQVQGYMHGYNSQYGWYDYDPFWGYNSYDDQWFGYDWYNSPYFYDNYYRYHTMPWWVFNDGGSAKNVNETEENEPVNKEKPVRRGLGSDSSQRYTPPADKSTETGIQKPSTQPPESSDNDTTSNDSQKQKPTRRGDLK